MSFGSYIALPKKNTNGSGAPSFQTRADVISYSRISNSAVNITIKVSMQYIGTISSGGYVDGGDYTNINATIGASTSSGSVSKMLTIKQASTWWSGVKKGTIYTAIDYTDSSRPDQITLTVPSYSSGETITVWYNIGNGGASWVTFASLSNQYTYISAPALLYTSCTPVTSISVSGGQIHAGDIRTISFGGASGGVSNAITGYYFQYCTDSTGWIDIGKKTNSFDFTFSSGTTNYYFRCYTVGSVSGYDSGWSSTFAFYVNTKPTISNLQANVNKLPYSGGSIKFSYSGSDPDGTALTYYYTCYYLYSYGPSGVYTSGSTRDSSVTLGFAPSSMNCEGVTFQVQATDGHGGASGVIEKRIYFNKVPAAPTINKVEPYNINRTNYIKINIARPVDSDGDNLTYRIYRNNSYISEITGTTFQESIASFPENDSAITYRVTAYDGYDESGKSNELVYYRNKKPSAPMITSVYASGKNPETEEYANFWANEFVDLNWTLNNNTGTSNLKGYYLDYCYGSSLTSLNGWIEIGGFTADTASYTHEISHIARGYYICYRIRAFDTLDEIGPASGTKTIQRSILPKMVTFGGNASSGAEYNIWDNRTLSLYWRASNLGPGLSYYKLKYIYDNRVYDLVNNSIISSGSVYEGGSISFEDNDYSVDKEYKIELTTLDNKLSTFISNFFTEYTNAVAKSGCFVLIPYDVFDVPGTQSLYYLNLDTRNTPALDNIKNKYTIYLPDGSIATSDSYNMVNFKEKIIFYFPKPNDYNKEEKFTCQFGVYEVFDKNSFDEEEKNNIDLYRELFSISEPTLYQGYYKCEYTIPSTSINKIASYCISVKDSTGLVSETMVFPATLEICRYTDPSLALNNGEWLHKEGSGDVNGVRIYSSLLDNGGSIIDPVRGLNYSDRRNLERFPENKKFKLFLECSETEDFNEVSTIQTEVQIYDTDDVEKNYYYKENSWDNIIDIGFIEENEVFILNSKKPWFIRLRLEITNTAKNAKDSETKIAYSSHVLLFADAPALSGRRHGVGINTASPEGRFHVNPGNNEEKEIAIFGPEKSIANARRVIIDLRNGSFIAGYFDPGDLDD